MARTGAAGSLLPARGDVMLRFFAGSHGIATGRFWIIVSARSSYQPLGASSRQSRIFAAWNLRVGGTGSKLPVAPARLAIESHVVYVSRDRFQPNERIENGKPVVKKILKAVLARCEWGHDDYSLKVENLSKAPKKRGQQTLFETQVDDA